jgi:hypothetical protein
VPEVIKSPETALLWAFSSADVQDSSGDFYECVYAAFDAVGTHDLTASTVIAWPSFSPRNVQRIAEVIRECLRAKEYDCPVLGDSFEVLRRERRTTVISDLVDALIEICG